MENNFLNGLKIMYKYHGYNPCISAEMQFSTDIITEQQFRIIYVQITWQPQRNTADAKDFSSLSGIPLCNLLVKQRNEGTTEGLLLYFLKCDPPTPFMNGIQTLFFSFSSLFQRLFFL